MESWKHPPPKNQPFWVGLLFRWILRISQKCPEITVFSEIETQLSFANAQNDPKSSSFWKKVSLLQKKREKVAVFLRKMEIYFFGKHDFALVYGPRTLKISKKLTFEQPFLSGFHFFTFLKTWMCDLIFNLGPAVCSKNSSWSKTKKIILIFLKKNMFFEHLRLVNVLDFMQKYGKQHVFWAFATGRRARFHEKIVSIRT